MEAVAMLMRPSDTPSWRREPSFVAVVELRLRLSLCVDETTEKTGAVCQRGLDVAEDCPFLLRKPGQSKAAGCQSGTEESASGSQTDW